MCLWLCGACRSENSLEADSEIRILMKMICWRNIPGRSGKELARAGEGGRARTSYGWQWFAAWYQKLWARPIAPRVYAPQSRSWLSPPPPHPDLQGGCLSPTQRSPIPREGGGSGMSLAQEWVHRAFEDLDHIGGLKFLGFWLPKHLCHVSVTQSMIQGHLTRSQA